MSIEAAFFFFVVELTLGHLGYHLYPVGGGCSAGDALLYASQA